jgi:hypothetical protein
MAPTPACTTHHGARGALQQQQWMQIRCCVWPAADSSCVRMRLHPWQPASSLHLPRQRAQHLSRRREPCCTAAAIRTSRLSMRGSCQQHCGRSLRIRRCQRSQPISQRMPYTRVAGNLEQWAPDRSTILMRQAAAQVRSDLLQVDVFAVLALAPGQCLRAVPPRLHTVAK